MNASAQDSSKKDDKTSRLRQLAPNSVIGDLAQARSGHTATRLDATRVLITGGDAGGTAEIFDAATGTSAATGSLSVARSGHTATRLDDGRVLILGGTSSGAATSSTEIYNAATGTFSAGASMNAARSGQTATVLADGRILIAGGDTIGSAEIYDATANTFTSISTMTVSRSGHSAALMNDGRALLVGGSDVMAKNYTRQRFLIRLIRLFPRPEIRWRTRVHTPSCAFCPTAKCKSSAAMMICQWKFMTQALTPSGRTRI